MSSRVTSRRLMDGRGDRVRRRLMRTRAFHALLHRLAPDLLAVSGNQPQSEKRFAHLDLNSEVLVYFGEDTTRLYQMQQWLPVFEQLHEHHRLVLVTRNLGSFQVLEEAGTLPLVYARRLGDVNEVLRRADPKLCLYVNNAPTNFLVLGWDRALHVHLNHGESDKVCMASNQAKAYDAVLVAGEAAELRYRENLLAYDGANLVRVGRPQLDLDFPRVLLSATLSSVLYAPTWEGETGPMKDYTSVVRYGPELARALVADGGLRLVYKPHPRILTGSKSTLAAHEEVVRTLTEASAGLPESERHAVELEAPILALFPSCDALISDVSSVALDWLYLRTDAPLWISDPRDDRQALLESSPVAACSYVLDRGVLADLAQGVRRSLEDDVHRSGREAARRLYFGELEPGQSTRQFLETIERLIARRDALLAAKDHQPTSFRIGAGVS